ncbi:MAG: diaminopropionate ammonia-lyase [Candidatus Omnitrophota bacterium]
MNERENDFDRCKFAFNSRVQSDPQWVGPQYAFLEDSDMLDFHRSLDGYAPTPLVSVPRLAAQLGVGELVVKDESHRFGIKAFKALGASYAIYRFLKSQWETRVGHSTAFTPGSFQDPAVLSALGSFTFCAATDGNHGRAVAWTAKKLNQRAVIYMPADTTQARIAAIEGEGADVILVSGTFDDCVDRCAADAARNGWYAISDTAYPGYTEIPKYIMLGYTSLFREMEDTLHRPGPGEAPLLDIVCLPAGVGGIAAAGTSYYVRRYGAKRPFLVCVEPSDCDCFLESVKYGNGEALPARGKQGSIMVGLNCGIPSPIAWPIVRDGMHGFLAVTDHYAMDAMRAYHGEHIVSGESGSAGLAGLIALMRDPLLPEAREKMGIGPHSRILLINTEGDTDPLNYQKIIQNS